jgi:hypothetical protein
MLMCGLVLLVATGCGAGEADRATDSTSATVAPSATARFCAGWAKAVARGGKGSVKEFLRDPPAEIATAVAVLLASDATGSKQTSAVDAANKKLAVWTELNCGDPAQRHVAPPAGTDLPALKLCSASGQLPVPKMPASGEQVVIYGEADRADPYDGPMIAVSTTKAGEGGYLGDGEQTPVTVRGKHGEAVPITVFQQVILPTLGTVIAWTEGGHDVSVFGRLWTKDRTADLVAIANKLELVDGRFVLPEGARPSGYKEVFAGPSDPSWSVIGSTITGDYHVRYQRKGGDTGSLTLDGLHLSAQQFDAGRLFAFPIPRVRIGDHDALFGSLWSGDKGPFVATWREADGFTVRVTGLGVTKEDVRAVAEHARDLTRTEWAQLVESDGGCKL